MAEIDGELVEVTEGWWPGDAIPAKRQSWQEKGYQSPGQEKLVQDIIRKRRDALTYLSGK